MADDNVTIAAKTIPWNGQTANVGLWIYATKPFVTEAGTPINATSPTDAATRLNAYKKATCTFGAGTITVPAITLSSTTDADVNNDTTLVAYFMDLTNAAAPRPILGFSVFGGSVYSFRVPPIPTSTNWGDLGIYFAGGIPPAPAYDVSINGNLTVTGDITGGDDLTIADDLTVGDDASIGGDLHVEGNLRVDGQITSDDTVQINDDLTVTGDVSVGDDLTVGDDGNFGGDVTAVNFFGNGSALTGISIGTSTGHSAIASLTFQVDSDNNGTGILDEMTGPDLSRRMFNDGSQEFLFPVTFSGGYQGQDLGGMSISVKAKGAVGDGLTDDRAAIQSAFDAADALGGCTVYFPHGDYLISGAVNPKDNTTVMGAGYGSRIICDSAGWFLVATVNMGMVNVNNVDKVRVTGLRLYGTKATDANNTPKLLYFEDVDGLTIDHCWFEHCEFEGIWQGGFQVGNKNIIVDSNHFDDVGHPSDAFVGLPAIQFNAEQAVISNNRLFNVGTGIGASGARLTIVGNFVKTCTVAGISIGDGQESGIISIVGNTVELNAQTSGNPRKGILLDGGSGADHITNVVGNTVRLIGDGTNIAYCYYVGTAKDAQLVGNVAEIQVRGAGFRFLGSAAGTTVAASGNIVKVVAESGSSVAFGGVPNGGGQTLTVRLSDNKVYGVTRAQGSYAFDFTSPTGTLNLTLAGDVAEEGNIRLVSTFYDGTAGLTVDGLPLYENSDTTKNSSVTRAAEIGMLNLQASRSLTIASGAITLVGHQGNAPKRHTLIRLDTEGGAATDDLDTINGGQAGDVVILHSTTDGADPTIKNNTGNIRCGADFTLATRYDRIMLVYDSVLSKWCCVSKMTN